MLKMIIIELHWAHIYKYICDNIETFVTQKS